MVWSCESCASGISALCTFPLASFLVGALSDLFGLESTFKFEVSGWLDSAALARLDVICPDYGLAVSQMAAINGGYWN